MSAGCDRAIHFSYSAAPVDAVPHKQRTSTVRARPDRQRSTRLATELRQQVRRNPSSGWPGRANPGGNWTGRETARLYLRTALECDAGPWHSKNSCPALEARAVILAFINEGQRISSETYTGGSSPIRWS